MFLLKHSVRHQKITPNQEYRHLKLMILALFYVLENARIRALWNYSFDTHLNYLGPISCFSPPWIPSGCTIGGGYGDWQLNSLNILCYWHGRWHYLSTGLSIFTKTSFFFYWFFFCSIPLTSTFIFIAFLMPALG